jgi:hypothetical protein
MHPSVLAGLALLSIAEVKWREVVPGVTYAAVELVQSPIAGDGVLHVVRIDPATAKLVAKAASAEDGKTRTAAEWSKDFRLAVVINAGMYEGDFSTHTGYFRSDQHVNSKRWVGKYQSVLAFGAPGLVMIDRDVAEPVFEPAKYSVVIQNLRLIKGPGKNVWPRSDKMWSEAALAVDRRGRLLFLFSRSPLTMHDFNEKVLALPLEITRAQHAEGGPEASLSIHAAGIDLDLSGSYETGFNENDDNLRQWSIPNILGCSK